MIIMELETDYTVFSTNDSSHRDLIIKKESVKFKMFTIQNNFNFINVIKVELNDPL